LRVLRSETMGWIGAGRRRGWSLPAARQGWIYLAGGLGTSLIAKLHYG